jgi:hypothetical protein
MEQAAADEARLAAELQMLGQNVTRYPWQTIFEGVVNSRLDEPLSDFRIR